MVFDNKVASLHTISHMSQESQESQDRVIEMLRSAGLRATRARIEIGKLLAAAALPLGFNELESGLKERCLPRSTIYRAVNEMTEAGILTRYEFEEGFARYEIAGFTKGHHHHFVCRSCKTIIDLEDLGELERHMGRAEAQLETATGMKVEEHRLDLFGSCRDCVERARARSESGQQEKN